MRFALPLSMIGLLVGCSGTTGPQGPTGPVGPTNSTTSAPALNDISPVSTLSGESAVVEIGGFNTHFSATGTSVSFGDAGITVGTITVGATNFLSVPIQVTPAAQVGPHTVTVTTTGVGKSSEVVTLTGIFTVAASLAGVAGGQDATTQAGGILNFSVENLNSGAPFAGTPGLGQARILNFTQPDVNHLSGVALVNALQPAGPMPLTALFTEATTTTSFSMSATDPNVTTATARTPTMLTAGSPTKGATPIVGENFASGPNPSNLYQFSTTAANQVMVATVVSTGGGLVGSGVYGVTAPSSGQFSQGQFFTISRNGTATLTAVALLPTMGTQYMALFPAQFKGTSGMDYSLAVNVATATQFSSKEGSTPSSATNPVATLTLTTPAYSLDGAINVTNDADFIKITTPNTGNLYVFAGLSGLGATNITYTPEPMFVSIYAGDCTTILASKTLVQQQSSALAGSTYCAKIEHQGTVNAPIPYQLVISQDL